MEITVKLAIILQKSELKQCYSVVELKTSWKNETCIHVKLGNFIFFPIWFGIVLYINRWFVINEIYSFSFNYL